MTASLRDQIVDAIDDAITTHALTEYTDGSRHGTCESCGWKGHINDHQRHIAEKVADRLQSGRMLRI